MAVKERRRVKIERLRIKAVAPADLAQTPEMLLAELNAIAPAKPLEKVEEPPRPAMPLPGSAIKALKEWADLKALDEKLSPKRKQAFKNLRQEVLTAWIEWYWKNRRIANPILVIKEHGIPDIQAIFQVHKRFTIEIPDNTRPEDYIRESLIEAGLRRESVERLIRNEIDFSPSLVIYLSSLVKGDRNVEASDATRSAAQKLMGYILSDEPIHEPLTSEERKVLLQKYASVTVREGFLQRAITYARSAKDLKAIFAIIRPICFASHLKYGMNDAPQDVVVRLLETVSEIVNK